MSGTNTLGSTLPAMTGSTPSFNVEVPYATAALTGTTYLRVGAPDTTSGREVSYYANALKGPKPGILMISPGDLTQIADSSVTFKTSAEAMTVSATNTMVISATYSFEETGTYRDVGYKYGRATSWSMGDSQTFKAANNTDVAVTNDQKLSLSTGFTAKIGLDTTVSYGPLSIAVDQKGIDVKSPILGNYKTTTSDSTEGGDSLTLTLNPLNKVYLAKVTEALGVLKALTALIAAIAAMPLTAGGGIVMSTAVKDGKVTDADIAQLKSKMKAMVTGGFVELGLLTAMQVAFGLLGSLAAANKAAAAANPLLPKIEMTPGTIRLSVGPTSYIEIGAAGIELQNGLMTNLTLSRGNSTLMGSTAVMTSVNQNSYVSATNATMNVAGIRATVAGRAALELTAAAVSVAGNATVAIKSPATSFAPA